MKNGTLGIALAAIINTGCDAIPAGGEYSQVTLEAQAHFCDKATSTIPVGKCQEMELENQTTEFYY